MARQPESSAPHGWKGIAIERRWEPADLISKGFDRPSDQCSTRLLVFTHPRASSYTFCRFLMAAGWGIPHEYFHSEVMQKMSSRLLERPLSRICGPDELRAYRTALERRRAVNGVFSIKLMWPQYLHARKAFGDTGDELNSAHHIYLRRQDFASQIASFMVQQVTGIYSFSDAGKLKLERTPTAAGTELLIRTAELLIAFEGRWLAEFASRGWKPFLLHAEDLLGDAEGTFGALSQWSGLPVDWENISACAAFERNGRYAALKQVKDEILEQNAAMLAEFSARREAQMKAQSAGLFEPRSFGGSGR